MLDICKQLFEDWNNKDIEYCHWKSNEHLKEGLCGITDLDILVNIRDKEKCEESMKLLDILQLKSQYGSRYPDVDDWVGMDKNTGKLIHIHLHYKIITVHKGMKEYNLPWSDIALKTSIKDRETDIYIMEPNLEIMTLYTRIALKASVKKVIKARINKFKLGADDLAEISYLKKRVDWEKVKHIIEQYYDDYLGIYKIIIKENLSSHDFINLRKKILKSMNKHRRGNALKMFIDEYYFAIVLKMINFVRHKCKMVLITRKVPISEKGLMVTFIGQDGSGKSTVTDEIEKWMSWKMDARKFYLGSGEHYNSWQKKIRDKLPNKKSKITLAISGWLTLSDLKSLAKNTYKTICKAQKYSNKGGIAIFDRYPQVDFLGINDGPKIRSNYIGKINNKILKKYAMRCADKEEYYLSKATSINPQLVFKLMLPPKVSIMRKPEEDLEMVTRKHNIIKKLNFIDADIHIIDATQDYNDEIYQIRSLLWEKIQK